MPPVAFASFWIFGPQTRRRDISEMTDGDSFWLLAGLALVALCVIGATVVVFAGPQLR